MTLSSKVHTNAAVSTLLNLSTSKRTFMILSNPDGIRREDWAIHIHVFGLSFVYFGLKPTFDWLVQECSDELVELW